MKSRKVRQAGHVACTEETDTELITKPEGEETIRKTQAWNRVQYWKLMK
jgi:hypothetical protein